MPTLTTTTCPVWCRTDHVGERRRWARMQEQVDRYMRAPANTENQEEMRYAFGPDIFSPDLMPPAADPDFVLFHTPLHEQEIGAGSLQDVRVVVQQAAGDEQPSIELIPSEGNSTYTARQARTLASLLVRAAKVLEE